MFSTLHPNRWILYAVAFPIVIFELLMWQIGLYAIEQRYAPYATDAQASDLIYQIHKNRRGSKLDISGWKTYRNEKYGFEFQYQKDFSIKELTKGEGIRGDYDLFFWVGKQTLDQFNESFFERGTDRGIINGLPAQESIQTGTFCIYKNQAFCFEGIVDDKAPVDFLSTLKFFEPKAN